MHVAIAEEINKASYHLAIASEEAHKAWLDFISSFSDAIILDVFDYTTAGILAITLVFPDGFTVTGSIETREFLFLGGAPRGTIAFINGTMFVLEESSLHPALIYDEGYERLGNNLNVNK